MKKPNFLIIGAPKAGTTSLYYYLQQHPDIQFSKMKEPKYFSFKDSLFDFSGHPKGIVQIKKTTITNLDNYLNLFTDLNAKYIGEASPNYFHFPPAVKNIHDFNPHMKLIVILRDPVTRAYSDWKHNVKMGWEPIKNFKKAIYLTDIRKQQRGLPYYEYLGKGNYATHLKRYYKYFPPEQLKVLFYEDLEVDASDLCNEIAEFLGTRKFHFRTEKIFMKNDYTPRNEYLHRWAKKIGYKSKWVKEVINGINALPQNISERDRKMLINYYRPEVNALEELTGKELTNWLT